MKPQKHFFPAIFYAKIASSHEQDDEKEAAFEMLEAWTNRKRVRH